MHTPCPGLLCWKMGSLYGHPGPLGKLVIATLRALCRVAVLDGGLPGWKAQGLHVRMSGPCAIFSFREHHNFST